MPEPLYNKKRASFPCSITAVRCGQIGTAKSTQRTIWESNGATFPCVLAPFGMVQITPNGYRYTDSRSFFVLP
jgi:hypothetical protein